MLEKIPSGVGHALRGLRAGFHKIVSEQHFGAAPNAIVLQSAAFDEGGPLPPRFTADGQGVSPPLSWRGLPDGVRSLVLIVEDPDAPSPEPLVHLLAWALPPTPDTLPEGEWRSPRHAGADEGLGRNAFLKAAYLPPDPPAGHGPHRYVFQLFALDRVLQFDRAPGRGEVVEAMVGRVLAKGLLVGTYERP
jgi:Raf kinase inhibitor-like YbhB/YbcL family protein